MADEREQYNSFITGEPFELLSDETRRAIIRDSSMNLNELESASFSELRQKSDVSDPGLFRYHLNKLLGGLLTRDQDGYQPRFGTIRRAISLSASDPKQHNPLPRPISTNFECPYCERRTVVEYTESEILLLDCFDHNIVFKQQLPPTIDSDDPALWVDYAIQRFHNDLELIDIGLCPLCQGTINSSISWNDESADMDSAKPAEQNIQIHHRCQECHYESELPVGTAAIVDQRVIKFFGRNGMNIRTRPFPQKYVSDVEIERESETKELQRIRVTYTVNDKFLTVTLDDAGTVSGIEA